MKHCFYISFFFCFLSCNTEPREQYPRYKDFPEEKVLSSEVISLDTVLFRYPFRVMVRDSVALVLDLHNRDHYLHAFGYPGGKHIVSFGRRGNGPEELLSVETFQFNSPDSVWVLDANKRQITRWRMDMEKQTAERLEVIDLDKRLIRTLDFYETPVGFIVPDYTGEHRYHLLNRQGEWIQSGGTIPTETEEAATPVLAQAWRSFIGYHSATRTVAFVTQLGEVLETTNLTDQTTHVVYGPQGEPEFQTSYGESIPTGVMGFSDIQVAGKYIYTVFHGRTFKEIEKNMREGKKNEDGGRFIYVFDLVGNPVVKYTLDRAIYGIHVNEDSGTIIATDVNSDEPLIQLKIENGFPSREGAGGVLSDI